MGAVLGLDTATDDTAVAVIREGSVIFDEIRPPADGRPLHGPALLEMVEVAVGTAGGWGEIELIAVGTGPGSFTGLRVGLATAKALAKSADCRISGVSTLDALAAGAAEYGEESLRSESLVCALDARREQVFAARYGQAAGSAATRVIEPFVCEPSQLKGRVGEIAHPALAVGSGALRFRELFEVAGLSVPEASNPVHKVSARWVAWLGSAEEGPAEPIYLRAPDAERWRERDKQKRDRS